MTIKGSLLVSIAILWTCVVVLKTSWHCHASVWLTVPIWMRVMEPQPSRNWADL